MKKLFILLVKFIPVIQMAGMLVNNSLYYTYANDAVANAIDLILGNSIIVSIVLYMCNKELVITSTNITDIKAAIARK